MRELIITIGLIIILNSINCKPPWSSEQFNCKVILNLTLINNDSNNIAIEIFPNCCEIASKNGDYWEYEFFDTLRIDKKDTITHTMSWEWIEPDACIAATDAGKFNLTINSFYGGDTLSSIEHLVFKNHKDTFIVLCEECCDCEHKINDTLNIP